MTWLIGAALVGGFLLLVTRWSLDFARETQRATSVDTDSSPTDEADEPERGDEPAQARFGSAELIAAAETLERDARKFHLGGYFRVEVDTLEKARALREEAKGLSKEDT